MLSLVPSLLLGATLASANPISSVNLRTHNPRTNDILPSVANHLIHPEACEFAFGTRNNSFASNLTRIVTFGDSISDSGRGYELSGHTQPDDKYYVNHAWSNGPVYPVLLSERMGVPLLGCAIGGATSNNTRAPGQLNQMPVPAAIDQVDMYLAALGSDVDQLADRLHIVLVGQNNINAAPSTTGADAVEDIKYCVDKLLEAGAKHILLFNLGAPFLGEWATSMRDAMYKYYPALNSPDENPLVGVVDINTVAATIDVSYEQFGYNETTRGVPCLISSGLSAGATNAVPTICENPDQRVFWDGVHPSRRTHSLYAAAALAALKTKGWAWRV